MTTHIILILGLLAIALIIALDIARQRHRRLCEDVDEYHDAAQAYVAHVDALETYCSHLEAVNRHNNAIAAGGMLRMAAVDVGERMTMEEGSIAP